MEAGSSQLPTAKPSRGTLVPGQEPPRFRLRGCHPLRRAIPGHFGYHGSARWGSNPQPWSRNPSYPHGYPVGDWFGLSPFRSPLLRGSLLVSFPPPTKMFPFGGFPSGTPAPTRGTVSRTPRAIRPRREVPFGDPGFNGRVRLPRAYRSLPRPSSAPEPSHPPGGVGAAGPGTRGGAPDSTGAPWSPYQGSWMSPSRAYLSMALTTAPIRG